ncbi:hypothetical protein ACFQT0_26055 [Hymenobacter humi]|uniref:NADH:flavin oxidoreductase/NADH oxidase N-terminal domain-containing protein n=1 Tax=Hymenobacter humi TaxID=1411620 RepID=A0ABW2TXV3_9BACT
MAEYYRQRATAGLIITEGTSPAANGLGYARIPGLFNQEQVTNWQRVTETVHHHGGHIFVQLMHAGRIFHPHNLPEGAEGVAPSAIAAAGDMWTDQEQMQPQPAPAPSAPRSWPRCATNSSTAPSSPLKPVSTAWSCTVPTATCWSNS